MTDTGVPTAEDAMPFIQQQGQQEDAVSAERLAADATAKVFVTTIAEGVIQSLVNIMQQKEGGMTQEDLTAVYCLASLYGVDVEQEETPENEESAEGPLLDENGNPIEYEEATPEELEAAFNEEAEGAAAAAQAEE